MNNRRTAISITACMLLSGGNSAFAFTSSMPTHTRSSAATMNMSNNRRDFLANLTPLVAGAAFTVVSTPAAQALDFEAFANSEIENDTKKCDPKKDPKCIPVLSDDEALCQYGGGGKARGEACMRVKKAGGKLPEVKKEKSLGGAYAM
ncbi:hypothetical protein ACHAWT_003241 [Skeletonema menzelii]|eukprot:scaffold3622_cov144-Skeletonema_menzelii.AAC.5